MVRAFDSQMQAVLPIRHLPVGLSRHACRKEIPDSGSWNVQRTNEPYDAGFLNLIEERLRAVSVTNGVIAPLVLRRPCCTPANDGKQAHC